MRVDSLAKPISPVNPDMTLAECIGIAANSDANALGLVDHAGRYLGAIKVSEIWKTAPLSCDRKISECGFAVTRLPTAVTGSAVSALELGPAECSEDYLVVVDENDFYRGLVSTKDILAVKLQDSVARNVVCEAVHEALQYGFVKLDGNGDVVYCNDIACRLLKMPEMFRLEDLPGASYIVEALENGTPFKELTTTTAKETKFLMDIIPLKQADRAAGVAVTYRSTNSIRHFVILETIFGSMREGVNIVDEAGILRYVNSSSARYVNLSDPNEMVGWPIEKFYPDAVLLKVIKSRQAYTDQRVLTHGRVFVTNAVPLFIDGEFKGGIATFREITEIIQLTKRLATMEEIITSMEFELSMTKHSDVFNVLVGSNGSLKPVIDKAQRCIAALGGPRHCIITGETGTGKTALAKAMYYFAKRIGVIDANAPFVEVNCAQFTNPDIAAIEIFGSEKGAFTGAMDKKGLVELADNGIIFLDEAHALGPHQVMLLKIIEEGMARRIGGRTEKEVNVIVITASTKNLKEALLPELYQRLAQYQVLLEPLYKRPREEKKAMLEAFLKRYEEAAREHYGFSLNLTVTAEAEEILLTADYPRNIRQFRDIVNTAVDAALPLVFSVRQNPGPVIGIVDIEHLPKDILEMKPAGECGRSEPGGDQLCDRVRALANQGLGARRIARVLKDAGIDIEFYQITYLLQKMKKSNS